MALGEDVDDETLGGAEMHARTSGLADHLAADERDALRLGRRIVADLGWRKAGPGPSLPAEAPRYAPEELLGCAASDPKRSVEVRDVLARVLDGSRLSEFKPLYGTTLVCGWGSLAGHPVGVLANNGILFSEESQKGAQFIQLAGARSIPLLFVQNITGFMVGSAYERGGIIKDGAKLINAVSNSAVPHLTLMVGASYGAGNYGMSGRAYDPRFVFTWPNHRIAVMGGAQLAGVMSMVQRRAAERAGRAYDEEDDRATRTQIEENVEARSNAIYASGRMWDDGVIDPRDTRSVLALALSAVHSAPIDGATRFAPFRM
jgi:acetyl-CoA carboxylase carboxyltransferase component